MMNANLAIVQQHFQRPMSLSEPADTDINIYRLRINTISFEIAQWIHSLVFKSLIIFTTPHLPRGHLTLSMILLHAWQTIPSAKAQNVIPGLVSKIFQINGNSSSAQSSPHSTRRPGGGYALTWTSANQDGSGDGVFAQQIDANGAMIGNATQVNTYWMNNQNNSKIALLDDGSYIITWQSYGQVDGNIAFPAIYAQRLDAYFNKKGSEFQVVTGIDKYLTLVNHTDALPAPIDNGFVIIWHHDKPGYFGKNHAVLSQNYNISGDVIGYTNFLTADTYYAQYLSGAWTCNGVEPSVTRFQGGVFYTFNCIDGRFVSIRMPAKGINGLIIDGSQNRKGVLVQPIIGFGPGEIFEFPISTYSNGSQQKSQVAKLSNGGVVVVWQNVGQDGDGSGIYFQLYDAAGNKVNGETQANTLTTGDQVNPCVTVPSNGSFIVFWFSGNPATGKGYTLRAQLFDNAGNKINDERAVTSDPTDSEPSSFACSASGTDLFVNWKNNPSYLNITTNPYKNIVGCIFSMNATLSNSTAGSLCQIPALTTQRAMPLTLPSFSDSSTTNLFQPSTDSHRTTLFSETTSFIEGSNSIDTSGDFSRIPSDTLTSRDSSQTIIIAATVSVGVLLSFVVFIVALLKLKKKKKLNQPKNGVSLRESAVQSSMRSARDESTSQSNYNSMQLAPDSGPNCQSNQLEVPLPNFSTPHSYANAPQSSNSQYRNPTQLVDSGVRYTNNIPQHNQRPYVGTQFNVSLAELNAEAEHNLAQAQAANQNAYVTGAPLESHYINSFPQHNQRPYIGTQFDTSLSQLNAAWQNN